MLQYTYRVILPCLYYSLSPLVSILSYNIITPYINKAVGMRIQF